MNGIVTNLVGRQVETTGGPDAPATTGCVVAVYPSSGYGLACLIERPDGTLLNLHTSAIKKLLPAADKRVPEPKLEPKK